MKQVINLFEITEHESGIIIYPDNGVIVTNWAGHTGLPRLMGALGIVYLGNDEDEVEQLPDCADILTVLPGTVSFAAGDYTVTGMDILADAENDIPALFGYPVQDNNSSQMRVDREGNQEPTPGHIYQVGDVIVIAPDGWN